MDIPETLSYDDILLLPGYSELLPRNVSVRTRLAGELYLNAPVLSAAMDTVTEEKLAIARKCRQIRSAPSSVTSTGLSTRR